MTRCACTLSPPSAVSAAGLVQDALCTADLLRPSTSPASEFKGGLRALAGASSFAILNGCDAHHRILNKPCRWPNLPVTMGGSERVRGSENHFNAQYLEAGRFCHALLSWDTTYPWVRFYISNLQFYTWPRTFLYALSTDCLSAWSRVTLPRCKR
ncbi:hypothetical protein PENSPDRAFT_284761 [Peniophora sp. CONT]|nr:hypothetical protein PENSPDRAFT_284761 [Peniophora sp. CONT]